MTLNYIEFAQFTMTSANRAAAYSDRPVIGQIVRVDWDYVDGGTGGSVWLAESGTAVEIHRVNGLAADLFGARPVQYLRGPANQVLSGTTGALVAPFITNLPLYVAGSTIGNGSVFGLVRVWYETDPFRA